MALRSTVKVIDKTRAAFRRIEKSSHDTLVDFCDKAKTNTAHNYARMGVYDTGNLIDSVDWEELKKMLFRLFTAVGYGAFQELGTSLQAARPGMAEGVAETVKEFHRGNKWGLR